MKDIVHENDPAAYISIAEVADVFAAKQQIAEASAAPGRGIIE